MKNKELIDTLTACHDKDLGKLILEYIEFTKDLSERGIQESLDEILKIKQFLIHQKKYQSYNSYTEIGSAEGGSLWIYAHLLLKPNAQISVIEIKPRPALHKTIEKLMEKGFNVDLHTENSKFIANLVESTDTLFIDGDHTYIGVKQDFDTWFPIVTKGGLCMLHDTSSFPGCCRLKNELKSKFRNIVTFSGAKCLHTLLDTFEQTQKACFAKGNFDFFYKELEPGTTIIPKQ